MNQALISSHDGIAGYWDGNQWFDPDPNDPKKLTDRPKLPEDFGVKDDDIFYLRYSTRGLMLDHELVSGIQVASTGTGAAEVTQGTMTLWHVARPNQVFFRDQLKHMRSYADLRDDRLAEIHAQIDDILSFFGAITLIDDQRRLRTKELLEAVVRLCIHVEMKVKHLCRAPRPVDYARQLQPMIQTPDHSSFPSGHATEAFAVATVLHRLMTGKGPMNGISDSAQVFRLAQRIAVNRTVAGVHFPVDTAAGATLGCTIGEYVFRRGRGIGLTAAPNVKGRKKFKAADDFSLAWLGKVLAPDAALPPPPASATILTTFWARAWAEFPH